jgi:hypothetical protein
MEEAPKRRRTPLFATLAGVLLLASVWAAMAFAGGSTQSAAKPVKAKAPAAAKVQAGKSYTGYAGTFGDHDCPNRDQGASNDL